MNLFFLTQTLVAIDGHEIECISSDVSVTIELFLLSLLKDSIIFYIAKYDLFECKPSPILSY